MALAEHVSTVDAGNDVRGPGEVLAELNGWVSDLLGSVAASEPAAQARVLTHATFGARTELRAYDLLQVAEDGRMSLTELGQAVARAAAAQRCENGPSEEWAMSVAAADDWIKDPVDRRAAARSRAAAGEHRAPLGAQ